MPLNLWGFAAITVPLVATPGASTAVVLRNSLAGGVRSGVATAIGANTGSICYGLLTAFGRRGRAAALADGVGRAALGRHGVPGVARRSARSGSPGRIAAPDARGPRAAGRPPMSRSVREGFVTNVLNPSLATFYLLILPQFIPRDAPLVASALTLTAFHVSLALTVASHVGRRRRHAVGDAQPHDAAPHPRRDQRRCAARARAEDCVRDEHSRASRLPIAIGNLQSESSVGSVSTRGPA